MMKVTPILLIVIAIALIVGVMGRSLPQSKASDAISRAPTALLKPSNHRMPPLGGATEWLNSPALAPNDLRGKVVLVQFWTYTCINWLRTLPHVRAWAEKYKDHGLVVIGVHSPEFEFEKSIDNVRRETKRLGIEFPVAVDSNHSIWRAFGNRYWPALYLIDAQGKVRHHQIGEGDYEQAERKIQQLLASSGHRDITEALVSVTAAGPQVQADWSNLRSGENYLGFGRTLKFASPGGTVPNRRHSYEVPVSMRLNQWALSGEWTMRKELTESNKANGRVAYRFHARDLHLVMGPAERQTPVRFRVLIDGQPPAEARGSDVDEHGNGTVTEQRLYQLIRQPGAIKDRVFEIEFLDAGIELFAFTFG